MPHPVLRLSAFTFFAAFLSAQAPSSYLGVLEDHPGHFTGDPHYRGVRAVFQKLGFEWEALPSGCAEPDCWKMLGSKYPREVTWTISFDGRGLGQITAQTPEEFRFYSDVGLQRITSSGPIPTIGKRDGNFSGWLGDRVFRPLIASSPSFQRDPDSWKPSRPASSVIAALRSKFREKFPKVDNCTKKDSETSEIWQYRDADIKPVKAYSSKPNWSVVHMQLEPYLCDGPPEDAFYGQWFVVAPGGEIRFLDQGMSLVDAGDYDNDGKSELVFSKGGYNQDGYVLFYEDFKKRVQFEFSYH